MTYNTSRFRNYIFRALLSFSLGLLLILSSESIMDYLIIIIGGLFISFGVISITSSFTSGKGKRVFNVSGFGSALLGLLMLIFPIAFSNIFFYFLGILLILAAIGQFVTISAINRYKNVSYMAYIIPVLILMSGLFMLFRPLESSSTMFTIFGLSIIFYSLVEIMHGFRLYRLSKNAAKFTDAEIVETDYEELPHNPESNKISPKN